MIPCTLVIPSLNEHPQYYPGAGMNFMFNFVIITYSMGNKRFNGQTAIITGSDSGIGKAIALGLAKEGANVVINFHRNEEAANDVIHEAEEYGVAAIAVQGDVSNERDVLRLFDKALEEFGQLHMLVNNAGIEIDKPFTDITLEEWNRVMNVNLTGYFLCARAAAKIFKEQGVIEGISKAAGRIVFVSSVHDRIPWTGHANYVASKGGVLMFMKTIAQELAPVKIRVNSISPGAIKTNINKQAWSDPDKFEQLLKMIPYGRIGMPEDIAKTAAWLLSDDADYVTGTTIYVDGGMMLYPSFEHGG